VRQLDTAGNEGSARLEPARRRPLETLAERLAGRKTWLFGARLAITMMVAEVVSLLVPLSRPYWLLLTTAVVLKPDYGSVFARGVQRTLGTLVGVMLGATVLELVPQGPLLLVPVAVFAFLFPFGASRNFGMLSTFLTPLTLILVEFGGAGTAGAALARLVDTVLGAAVVLVVGYLPWPSTWRPRLGHGVADGADALADYALVAIGNPPRVVAPARRRAFGALSDARSDLQSALAEPTPQARAASAWFPLVSQLEQTADDLRDVSMLEGRVAEHGPEPAVSEVVDGLHDLAEAIRQQRPPRELPLPATGMLQRVGADVEGARRIVTGGGED
jgi:uncharacterized membrane protein YccC